MFIRSFLFALFLIPLGLLAENMPLSEVKPGMRGIWKTVVSGTEIKEFRIEVIDVLDNFMAPGVPTIFCEALDADQIRIGGVAGMSGSPVYMDGKLVGAYALGFPFSKDQALIGVTPIAAMLDIYNQEPSKPSAKYAPKKQVAGQSVSAQSWKPTIQLAGVAPSTLEYLNTRVGAFSFENAQLAPKGRSSGKVNTNLVPGSAVGAVILGGDFQWAAVGTVTWREGDDLLAFGHPFLSAGKVDFPMAVCEVVVIVQNYMNSFKLSKVGQVVGSIHEDRLTGIAGKMGVTANTTACRFEVTNAVGNTRTLTGDLAKQWGVSPGTFGGALHAVLTDSMDVKYEQTFFIETTLKLKGQEPLIFRDVDTGEKGVERLSDRYKARYELLTENDFEPADIESATFKITLKSAWLHESLHSVTPLDGLLEPGDTLGLAIKTQPFAGPMNSQKVSVPLDKQVPIEELEVFVGDARSARKVESGMAPPTFQSLQGIIDYLRTQKTADKIYVKLLRKASGLASGAESLSGLPPAMLSLMNPKSGEPLGYVTLWEATLPVEGLFTGKNFLDLKTL